MNNFHSNITKRCLTNEENREEQEAKMLFTKTGFLKLFNGSSQDQLAKQGNMAKSHCAMELKSKQIICKLRGIYDNDPVLYVVSDNVWAVFVAQSTDLEDVGKESPLTHGIGTKGLPPAFPILSLLFSFILVLNVGCLVSPKQ